MPRPLTRTFGSVACVAFVVVAVNAACGLGVVHQCDDPDNVPRCDSATSYRRCSKTENGGELLTVEPCPDGRSCETASGLCVGKPVGSACSAHPECADNLRCTDNVCSGPTLADISRCEDSPLVDVPIDGTSVSIDVKFTDDVRLANVTFDGLCRPPDGGESPIRRFGIFRVHVQADVVEDLTLTIENDVEGGGPIAQLIGFPPCSDLYGPEYYRTCNPAARWNSGFIYTKRSDFAILVGLTMSDVSAVRFRIYK